MTIYIQTTTQRACLLRRFAKKALQGTVADLSISLASVAQMTQLNEQYRHKKSPTNVLSFPAESLPFLKKKYLGDIVICPAVVAKEAKAQHKELLAHWAHLVIHGVLHLMGYDHIKAADAKKMEAKEIDLLRQLGFNNPYDIT